MAKLSKEEQARRDGMLWAYHVASQDGVEALKQEIDKRGIQDIPVGIRDKELQKLYDETERLAVDCTLVMSLHTLVDEFDFDEEMCNRFKARYNSKTECLLGGYIKWKEVVESLSEEINVKLNIHKRDPLELRG